MSSDYEHVLAKSRAGPRARLRGSLGAHPGSGPSAGSGRRAPAVVRRLALPAADTVALVLAVALSGASTGGTTDSLLCALYVVTVLVVLAAGRQHRLRICLRVSDQAGRILIATTTPALVLLAWLPGTRVLALALWAGGLVFACRLVLCVALRGAHRRGLLTEPAVVVGAGTFGAYVAELMRTHPEFGLRPMGLLDDGPPRLDLPVPSLGSPSNLSERRPAARHPPGHRVLLVGQP